MTVLSNLTLKKALALLESGEVTSVQLTQYYLDQIAAKNGEVNAYLEVFSDALEQAAVADVARKAGNKGKLLGVPISIKDSIVIQGRIASAASKYLEKYVAPYDATAVKKLKEEGVVFLGRTNMDEFAMGGSTENSAYGPTRNPHDTSRVPGGTSGGAAASVAMDGCVIAIGSDTGGSIRQPASFCGVVGLKPTYGMVSRHGLMAMGSSLDCIGPLGRSIEDVEYVHDILKGEDIYDSTSLREEEKAANKKARGDKEIVAGEKLKIGIVKEFSSVGGLHPAVKENFEKTIAALKAQGHEVKEISLPNISHSLPVYYIIMPAEVSSNMSRFDGVKFGSKIEAGDVNADLMETRGKLLGKEVRRRIMLGTYVLSSGYYDAYYNKANIVRNLIRDDFKNAFKEVDVIITPTAPTPAFKIGKNTSDPIQMYLEDVFTVTANLVGVPGLAVPTGFTDEEGKKLPLGVQCMSAHEREDILFHIGKDIERIK